MGEESASGGRGELERALAFVKGKRSIAEPNEGFMEKLAVWHEGLVAQRSE